jgi:hypothetical protein
VPFHNQYERASIVVWYRAADVTAGASCVNSHTIPQPTRAAAIATAIHQISK